MAAIVPKSAGLPSKSACGETCDTIKVMDLIRFLHVRLVKSCNKSPPSPTYICSVEESERNANKQSPHLKACVIPRIPPVIEPSRVWILCNAYIAEDMM